MHLIFKRSDRGGHAWAAIGESGRRYVISMSSGQWLWRVYVDNVPVRGEGLGLATWEAFSRAAEFCQEQENAELEEAPRSMSPCEYAYSQDAATATGMYDD